MIEINQVQTTKLSILDGIELKSATFCDKDFPAHFHQSWSLAYIEYGSEYIAYNDAPFLVTKNALQLIPPYSIHKNWGNKNEAWTYKVLYISDDVIKHLSQKIDADYAYLRSLPYFISYAYSRVEISEASIFSILGQLFLDALDDQTQPYSSKRTHKPFEDVLSYLSLHYNQSITLETLQREFKVNKYNLQKDFKRKIGLTPLAYQTVIRIENSKKLFYTDMPLVEIALESGFHDQSHFTHSFKKYVGVTPGRYKKYTNILQDW